MYKQARQQTIGQPRYRAGRCKSTAATTIIVAFSAFFPHSFCLGPSPLSAANGELEIRIVDDATNQPIATQIRISDSRGRVRPIRRFPTWQDRTAIDGQLIVSLPPGTYTFEIDRGPEYLDQTGHFVIESAASDLTTVRMQRFTDLASQGWRSGDPLISRSTKDLGLSMRSVDLHVASVQSWAFTGNPKTPKGVFFVSPADSEAQPATAQGPATLFDTSSGRDARWGGQVFAFRAGQPILAPKKQVAPSTRFLKEANRNETTHLCVGQANAWDLPIWLASGYLDSFMLIGPEFLAKPESNRRDPTGYPRDRTFFPEPFGWGRWAQAIYYHALNCGFRLPPIAGSGSGFNNNPLGYARTYVHCGESLDAESWWEKLKRGRVIVTNGPLLIPEVNGQLPGHVFRGYQGDTVSLSAQLTLHTREKIEYLEIIKDGKVFTDVMLSELVDKQGVLPDVKFTESGWFLIRARTKNPNFHVVSTGPYYVEFEDKPRISRKSAQFFVDWLAQRKEKTPAPQVTRHDSLFLQAAEKFWDQRLEQATAN